ncbi:MAG: hypothetical protein UV61_C0017G0005 [Candidatus Gottesmanbacteria bacterium GW2011_GWB1_43_11]|uniref:HTH merR-type domain-containing protein n=1 Tax=Candidatus Gottesmanbacteria bacterium GW2011_GWB1_43_11 TaxID=1618446 RepID=A0A0G1CJ27_9BACT|nr:MAG: hypothetical protein UV17_C0019G0004 [Candidatus Gottesmanbacteria bacterium GW2011_GWA1_42_26]KKS85494.1 MAG: hypothetical protein UV61_C0017G0005 [Candidatus Gottesmanbacteria bacterium GW2011_GWB1_43_11]OGG09022.1 MAG: hypothetical protein A2699_03310 [Candidatus Gottesmanbacteria bacterium RIFCSPHIGHO2_01_FULL_43_15]HCM38186.1 hypothetical protein [Patescibacteria group bacterium]
MTTQQEQEQYLRRGRLLNQLERGNSISETDSAWFLGINTKTLNSWFHSGLLSPGRVVTSGGRGLGLINYNAEQLARAAVIQGLKRTPRYTGDDIRAALREPGYLSHYRDLIPAELHQMLGLTDKIS